MITRRNPLFFWLTSLHKATFFGVLALILIGLVVSFSLSFAASEKIGLKSSYIFFLKHFIFTIVAFCIIVFLSFFSPERLKLFCFFCISMCILGIGMTFLFPDIKGARRWLSVYGFSLQPSEFLKPFFIYTFSLLFTNLEILKLKFANSKKIKQLILFIIFFYILIIFLFFFQPDFGMILTFTLIFITLFYINLESIKKFFISSLLLVIVISIIGSLLPHVQNRVKVFLFGGENYQAKLAKQAIESGGFFGKGLSESTLKFILPEAHNDFIFAIIFEEFGMLFAIIVGLIFMFIIFSNFVYLFDFKEKMARMFARINPSSDANEIKEETIKAIIMRAYQNKAKTSINYLNIYQDFLFCRNFITSTCVLIFFEFFLNASVSLNLMPTKGIAMPFISYGGSSLIAHGILIGLLLGFNKKRYFFLI